MSLNVSRRVKSLSIIGALISNGASVYGILNRTVPFGFVDALCLLILNAMFLGFFLLAVTRVGSQDLKNFLNTQKEERPPRER